MPSPPPKLTPSFMGRYYKTYRYGFLLELPGSNITQMIGSPDSSDGNYVELTLNPQQISVREPLATTVNVMQGGGKLVESRGGVLKDFAISGTTGYLPPPIPGSKTSTSSSAVPTFKDQSNQLYDDGPTAESDRASRSGFTQFHKLRYIFRQFMYLRRTGQECYMHYFDFKGDEYWLIEPITFGLNRDARHPYQYQYSINFQGLEPTNTPQTTAESKASSPAVVVASTAARIAALADSGLAYVKTLSGYLERTLQGVLTDMGNYTQVVDDAGQALETLGYELPHNLLSQLNSSIDGGFDALNAVLTGVTASITTGPTLVSQQVLQELNEFYCEAKLIGYLADTAHQQLADDTSTIVNALKQPFTEQRALLGSSVDQLVPQDSSVTSPSLFDASYLTDDTSGITFDSTTQAAAPQIILSGETIFDVARRLTGSIHSTMSLIAVNRLSHPYIVASMANKPPGTLAWGEYIYVPASATSDAAAAAAVSDLDVPVNTYSGTIDDTGTNNQAVQNNKDEDWLLDQWVGYSITMLTGEAAVSGDDTRVVVSNDEDTLILNRPWTTNPQEGDTFSLTLDTFSLRKQPDRYTQIFYRDILLIFAKQNDGVTVDPIACDIRINSQNDIATISGQENFSQALLLKLCTERGRHPFHNTFGVGVPVGRPANEGNLSAYNYFARQSLLADPRVAAVAQPQFYFVGGALMFQAYVQPLGLKQSKFIKVAI